MSSLSLKIGIVVILIGMILGGVWYSSRNLQPSSGNPSDSTADSSANNGNFAASGSSNSSLDRDMAAIDVRMSALENDERAADESLNDQPISQEE